MDDCEGLANAGQLLSDAGRAKRRYKTVDLPVSGHKVRIRSLTERELSEYQTVTVTRRGLGLRRARLEDANRRLIVLCLVDGAGNRLLNDSHADKLAEWDSADTSFLYEEAANFVGLNKEDVEGLVKASERTLVDDSPSDSPA